MAEKPSDLGPDRVYTLFGEVPRLEARTVERKLAAIFAADVEGYSRLMGQDEDGTLRTLNRYRAIIDPLIASHRGRIFTTSGDSLVADFGKCRGCRAMCRRCAGGNSRGECRSTCW